MSESTSVNSFLVLMTSDVDNFMYTYILVILLILYLIHN